MQSLPPDFITRVRRIITPFITNEAEREALITEAYFLYDPILSRADLSGSPRVFCVRFINQVSEHCMPPRQHAIARLLETVRPDCGVNHHAEIDDLIQISNRLCQQSATPTPKPPLPSASPTTATQTTATPLNERTSTVFISYSHQDEAFAKQLIADLNEAGHACWIDTSEIKGGDEWIMTIAEGIINSYAFVPIVTAKALHSKWVQDEILWAKNKNKRIIPIILEDVLDETRFFPLVSYQGVTLFDSNYDSALPKLLSYLPAPSLPDVDIHEAEIDDVGDETATVVTLSPTRTTPRKLELAYMERLKLEELLNTEKYTELGGTSQVNKRVEMSSVFELIPVGRDEMERTQEERRTFENAVAEILSIRRCVLLGEPGGGKTTTIWKLAAQLTETALQDRTAPIPILIRLGKWTDAKQSLADFIATQLGDLGAHFTSLLSEKRAALLLDGLNELPASQHSTKYPQVQQFIEAHPDVLAVVSCRELDYTIDLGFDKINIKELDPLRIREFVGRYLGAEKGDDLFWKLAGDSAAQQHKRFIDDLGDKIDNPEQVFWIEDRLPASIAWGYTWLDSDNTYWHNWLKERENPSGLMVLARNPYMLLMLTSVYAKHGNLPANRGQLFAQFVDTLMIREDVPEDEQDPLITRLTKVAYEMQIRRADDESGDALTVLDKAEVEDILGERLTYLAGSASILSVGEQVRFTHQLLQEYFAAKYMDIEIQAGRLKASDIWQPDRWWERTNWEEATILLAGLYSDDPTPVVNWLMEAQPEVAAQCITRSGASKPPDDTLLKFRQHIPRMTDVQALPNPNSRAAIGRALGQVRLRDGTPLDNRKGVSVQDGLPDIEWVTIPAGDYSYQDSTKRLDYDFKISRYLVTYAQFQSFIDDPEGFSDSRWWQGFEMPEGHNDSAGDQRFKYWNHPRERVSWFDAMAFCRWFSWRLGGNYALEAIDEWKVRLPTEFEWEKAARGKIGWQYPYGDEFDASKGNTRETGLKQTSAVGIFAEGDTPHWDKPISDLSGNVREWCLSEYSNPAEHPSSENMRSPARRVLRGGSWLLSYNSARAVFRFDFSPDFRDIRYDGFRVCVPLL